MKDYNPQIQVKTAEGQIYEELRSQGMTKQEGRGVVGGEGQEEQKLKKHTKLII